MKRYFVIVAAVLWIVNLQGQSLSLEEAMGLMQSQNSKMKALQLQEEAEHYKHNQHLALRLPVIGLSAMATHINDELVLDLTKERNMAAGLLQLPNPAMLGDWRKVLQKKNMLSVDVHMMYPIFTGGKINAALKASELKSQIKHSEIAKVQNVMYSTLVEHYFKSRLAEAAVAVRTEAMELSKTHFQDAEKLEANGMIAQVEKMQAAAALADAKRLLLAAEQDEDLAKTALCGLLRAEQCEFSLSTDLFISAHLKPLSYYEEEAMRHQPDMEVLQLKADLAKQGVKASKSGYLPTVSLVGAKHVYTENVPLQDDLDWFLGVGVQYTLFNGFKQHNKLKEAKVVQESIVLFQEQAQKDIATLVKSYYQEMEKQKQLAEVLQQDLSFAQELMRVRQKAFAEGFAKSTDVVEASLYVASIKLKYLQALCNYDIALARLLEASGQSADFVQYVHP